MPTAERDATIGLSIFQPLFRNVRAVDVQLAGRAGDDSGGVRQRIVPGVVVGVGSDVPNNPQPARFRQKYNMRGPFAVYVGRIDENKGCKELFEFFDGYLKDPHGKLSLVLIGNSLLPIPQHPRIRHLGFLNDTDKFDAMAAADLLFMPSYYESLSMVALEAWALGRPVLANGRCDVLKGQCIRSNAGLYYDNVPEFVETLKAHRAEPLAERHARPQRPAVLSRALRLAGHRAEVSRHVRSAQDRAAGARRRSASRLVRASPAGPARRRRRSGQAADGPA